MIALNLLSPQQKKALRSRMIYALIERVSIVGVTATLLATIAVLQIRIELIKNLQSVQARQLLTANYMRANKDIAGLNAQIARVETLQKLAISPGSLLLDITGRTPPGVGIANLDFDVASGSMRIAGTAAQREDLLAFEEALKKSPFVKKLTSPISNLFEKTDISFSFDIALETAALHAAYEPTP